MVVCKCSNCNKTFEYDYRISICDECLTKYKKDLSVLTFAHRDECWSGENPLKETLKPIVPEELTESEIISQNEQIELKQVLESDCKGEKE